MDPYTIATIALGSAFALATGSWIHSSLSRRAASRAAADLTGRLAAATASIGMLRLGEREAAWAATTASDRLRTALLDLSKARHEIDRLGGDVDELSRRLANAEHGARTLAEQHAEAAARVARLESDLGTARELLRDTERRHSDEIEGLRLRLAAVAKERDQLGAAARRADAAEAELAALGRVHQELAAARTEIQVLHARLAAPVAEIATEALDDLTEEIEDLRAQLAARPDPVEVDRLRAELERTARQAASSASPDDAPSYAEWEAATRSRVARAVEETTRHLRAEVAHLRLVVAEKERMLERRGTTGPAPSAAGLPVTVIKGIGPAIAGILAEHGIFTVADVAALDEAAIDALGSAMPVYPGRIRRDNWVGQARTLAGL